MAANDVAANMATGPSVMGVSRTNLCFHTLMTTIAAADFLTGWVPGFKFRILSMRWRQNVPVTTAAKLATLTPYISGNPVTGGVVSLTSALCTPLGVVILGTPVTGANQGSKTDTISITGSAVTAFAEGSGDLILELENMDIPL